MGAAKTQLDSVSRRLHTDTLKSVKMFFFCNPVGSPPTFYEKTIYFSQIFLLSSFQPSHSQLRRYGWRESHCWLGVTARGHLTDCLPDGLKWNEIVVLSLLFFYTFLIVVAFVRKGES